MEHWLDKLHKTEIELLDEFDRICKKNNLQYFLTGGTLLGAVRHNGFIPWDDDIDVGMTREDYNKFMSCYKNDLNDKYELDEIETNDKYYLLFAKLRYKNTLCVEKYMKDLDTKKGIWIDIFPYDNVDNACSKKHYKMYKYRSVIQKMLFGKLKLKNPEFRKLHKKSIFLYDIFLPMFSYRGLIHRANKKLSHNKNNNSKYLSNMNGSWSIDKETHMRDDIYPTIDLNFEGKKYPCPNNYDRFLKEQYGDYMKLPPEDKRVAHNPLKLKYPDGEIIDFEK